jgi:FAD/FMN-containing dehydrogenase
VLSAYLEDASGYRGEADAIHVPANESELREILVAASRSRIPVTIAGAGTGVTGARVAHGGWVVSLEKFNEIDVREGEATAGAGVLLRDLQAAASRGGQFYAPDPTETSASIGGTIATNASGSRSFRYGDTRRHVLSMRVMLIGGRVLELKRGHPCDFRYDEIPAPATTKNTAGFYLRSGMDALDVFIGCEGTLGVVTGAKLRLLPKPAGLLTGVVFFAHDEDALRAVDAWRDVRLLRMLEYLDAGSLNLLRPVYPEIPNAARAALPIEQETESEDGLDRDVDVWLERLEAARALAAESWFGTDDGDRERFRRFRHALPERVNDQVRRCGLMKMGTDFAVPISQNREMMARYRARLEEAFSGRYVIFGHIGDAHVHANLLPQTEEEASRAQQVILSLARDAVALGGTVSAEHGLGKRKAHLLRLQFTTRQIQSMRQVKYHFDPDWLLGRGTLFDV